LGNKKRARTLLIILNRIKSLFTNPRGQQKENKG
jgi:hypothetical protein